MASPPARPGVTNAARANPVPFIAASSVRAAIAPSSRAADSRPMHCVSSRSRRPAVEAWEPPTRTSRCIADDTSSSVPVSVDDTSCPIATRKVHGPIRTRSL